MKIYLPWKNLGCLGFKCGRLYFDIYRTWSGFPLALFANYAGQRYRWSAAKGFRPTEN